jgi:hypothetical protein
MSLLNYSRLEVFLPCNTDAERYAVAAAEGWMRERFGGVTSSDMAEPVFHGLYKDQDEGRWIDDRIVIIMADSPDTADALEEATDALQNLLSGIYETAGSAQKDFWITLSPVSVHSPA